MHRLPLACFLLAALAAAPAAAEVEIGGDVTINAIMGDLATLATAPGAVAITRIGVVDGPGFGGGAITVEIGSVTVQNGRPGGRICVNVGHFGPLSGCGPS